MRPARRPGRQGRRDERPSRGTVVPDPSAPSRSLNESFRSIPLDPPPTAASSASATSAWIETERSKVIMGGAKAPAGLCCGDGEGRNRTGDTTVFSRIEGRTAAGDTRSQAEREPLLAAPNRYGQAVTVPQLSRRAHDVRLFLSAAIAIVSRSLGRN